MIVFEHDLDMIRNADYIVDMGPRGGSAGGRIVAAGTLEEIALAKESVTGNIVYYKKRDLSIVITKKGKKKARHPKMPCFFVRLN